MSVSGFAIVGADEAEDAYADSDDVPGEFRRLTDALGAEQVAITLIRVPPHSDFEQGTAGSVARVAPGVVRSHRNEGDEPVEIWAISRNDGGSDSTKVNDFWEASPEARQR
jgi:hypothetical protein